jgi:hypothetical protein
MIACNFKIKDIQNFHSVDGINSFIMYAYCAIQENEHDGAKRYADDWKRIIVAADDRRKELESEVKSHE